MEAFIAISFLVWFVSFLLSAFGYAANDIPCKPVSMISALIPILNTILAIYLWYKHTVRCGYGVKELVNDLKDL